jgi:hypothetical protein
MSLTLPASTLASGPARRSIDLLEGGLVIELSSHAQNGLVLLVQLLGSGSLGNSVEFEQWHGPTPDYVAAALWSGHDRGDVVLDLERDDTHSH